ncbi:stAR-related lipid transfer protein 3 isoform X2 [Folsomia candida]|uniref:stAR-related lipid transfer protein 3 isoform X2 n=1 Tax=Folsomia candida TaxID=158441 RepID=UPI000B8F30ED|nr:stAR-related lipid transfer protein 3 isoform X2 [Folsomia candida]
MMEGYSAYVIPSEDVLLGTQTGRHLSPVRRFFCLLVTFDLLFTILLWVLSIILMCAGIRFVFLLLFYALLRCHHWLPVALTTALTCAFLLVKVFLFHWDTLNNATYPVMLILSSFVLSWSEAWFFDFRLIPQEIQAAMFHARQSSGGVGGESQRVITWLGRSVSQIAQNVPIQRSYPASTADFFSLPESPMTSDDEDSETESMEKRARRLYKANNVLPESPECKLWIQQAPTMSDKLLARVQQSGWVLEKTSDNGDSVFILKSPRKVFMISGTLTAPPAKVAFELFQRFEYMPRWNPAVTQCEIIQRLGPSTDVSYQVSKEGAGGAVSPRDFVTLRHHKICPDGIHILASESVKHPAKPKQPKITRAFNGTMGFVLSPVDGQPCRTTFQWVLDVDLQIPAWIPRAMVDKAFITASLETMICLRAKLAMTVDQIPLESVDPGTDAVAGPSVLQ